MKKILSVLFIAMLICLSGILLTGCEDPVLSIAIKNGANIGNYYCDYGIGDSLDYDKLTIVVKTKKTSYEIELKNAEVYITGFSTDEVTDETKTATVTYKGVQTTFAYTVSEREIPGNFGLNGLINRYYSGENIDFAEEIAIAEQNEVTVDIIYAPNTPHGIPNTSFEGVSAIGEYSLIVNLSRENYKPKTCFITLVISPKPVNVELAYLPGELSLEERANLDDDLWKKATDAYWKSEIEYFSGYQLFARVAFDDVCESLKDTQSKREVLLSAIMFGLISDYEDVNSNGSFNAFVDDSITNFKLKINSANSSYEVKQTEICLTFKKADANMIYEDKSFKQAIEDTIGYNSLTLTKNGNDYSLNIAMGLNVVCPVSGQTIDIEPHLTFTENTDNSVSVTIVFETACYSTVTLTKTFQPAEIL